MINASNKTLYIVACFFLTLAIAVHYTSSHLNVKAMTLRAMASERPPGTDPQECMQKAYHFGKAAGLLLWCEMIVEAAGIGFWIFSIIKKETATIVIPSALIAFYVIFCWWFSMKTI